jgi:hypothetical protein
MARPYDPTGRAAKAGAKTRAKAGRKSGQCGNEIALLEIAITARYGAGAG